MSQKNADPGGRRNFLRVAAGLITAALPSKADATLPSSVGALIAHLQTAISGLVHEPQVIGEWKSLRASFGLSADEMSLLDFTRVRTLFEATRSGGLWRLRWEITNQKPTSARIWTQWRNLQASTIHDPQQASASAECDELSALFAFLAYRCGVRGVGLFWPVWNHVVAVWVVRRQATGQPEVRIVVPTSQIMLPTEAGLGDRHFDVRRQKTIYEYRREDIRLSTPLPNELVHAFVTSVEANAARSHDELAHMRRERLRAIGGLDTGK